jgi:hypothetical protein
MLFKRKAGPVAFIGWCSTVRAVSPMASLYNWTCPGGLHYPLYPLYPFVHLGSCCWDFTGDKRMGRKRPGPCCQLHQLVRRKRFFNDIVAELTIF